MRGLDIRCAHACAKLAMTIHGAAGDPETDASAWSDEMNDTLFDAQAMGYHDYVAGVVQCPELFKDVKRLAKAWHDGQHIALMSDEMSTCEECQNEDGHPCSVHG